MGREEPSLSPLLSSCLYEQLICKAESNLMKMISRGKRRKRVELLINFGILSKCALGIVVITAETGGTVNKIAWKSEGGVNLWFVHIWLTVVHTQKDSSNMVYGRSFPFLQLSTHLSWVLEFWSLSAFYFGSLRMGTPKVSMRNPRSKAESGKSRREISGYLKKEAFSSAWWVLFTLACQDQ